MSEIRKLTNDELKPFAEIAVKAYPGMPPESGDRLAEITKRLVDVSEHNPTIQFYGLFRDGKMLGGMRFHDFEMNFFGRQILVGGVGMVAVDLIHKKEHIAKEMLVYFHQHYREKGAALTSLYPFRPDFYRKMGYGYGSKKHVFSIKPANLPATGSKTSIVYLSENDIDKLDECYHRYAAKRHGIFRKTRYELQQMFKYPNHYLVGQLNGNSLDGYLFFSFDTTAHPSMVVNDLRVAHFIYDDPRTMMNLLRFLHDQDDQIRRITFYTQDDYFHHLLDDPRDSSDNLIPSVYHQCHISGLGVMYRVIDPEQIITLIGKRNQQFPDIKLQINLHDSFMSENNRKCFLYCRANKINAPTEPAETPEVTLSIDVKEFSELVMNVVDANTLSRLGLLQISDEIFLPRLQSIFKAERPPECLTAF